MARWNKEGIPHKGWRYIGIEDLAERSFDDDIPYEQCEMCGNEKIRYVHILTHPEYDGELRVGCDCASRLTDDYINPRQHETDLKNRLNRRKNFENREWQYVPRSGNFTLRYKGENITIMKSKYGSNWGIAFRNKYYWDYQEKKIRDFETAKQIAFELFDEQHQ